MTSIECSLMQSLRYAVFQSHDRRREIVRLNDEIAKYKEQVKQQKEELTQLHWDTKDMHSDQWYIEELTEENIQLKEKVKLWVDAYVSAVDL